MLPQINRFLQKPRERNTNQRKLAWIHELLLLVSAVNVCRLLLSRAHEFEWIAVIVSVHNSFISRRYVSSLLAANFGWFSFLLGWTLGPLFRKPPEQFWFKAQVKQKLCRSFRDNIRFQLSIMSEEWIKDTGCYVCLQLLSLSSLISHTAQSFSSISPQQWLFPELSCLAVCKSSD